MEVRVSSKQAKPAAVLEEIKSFKNGTAERKIGVNGYVDM